MYYDSWWDTGGIKTETGGIPLEAIPNPGGGGWDTGGIKTKTGGILLEAVPNPDQPPLAIY